MKAILALVCTLCAYGLVDAGGEMPQGMIDGMMGEFFKFCDTQFAEVLGMIQTSLDTAKSSSEKDLKQLMKDMKESIGLSSPFALVGQFSDQVGLFVNQYPGGTTERLTPFLDYHTRNMLQLKKLPPFAMKDRRAPGLMDQFKAKIQGYMNQVSEKAKAAQEAYLANVAGYKGQMQQLLQKSGGERGRDSIPELNSKWTEAQKSAREELTNKLAEFSEGIFAEYAAGAGA